MRAYLATSRAGFSWPRTAVRIQYRMYRPGEGAGGWASGLTRLMRSSRNASRPAEVSAVRCQQRLSSAKTRRLYRANNGCTAHDGSAASLYIYKYGMCDRPLL